MLVLRGVFTFIDASQLSSNGEIIQWVTAMPKIPSNTLDLPTGTKWILGLHSQSVSNENPEVATLSHICIIMHPFPHLIFWAKKTNQPFKHLAIQLWHMYVVFLVHSHQFILKKSHLILLGVKISIHSIKPGVCCWFHHFLVPTY